MRKGLAKSWISVLKILAQYYVLVRPQIQTLVFPTNKHSRFCRNILNEMTRKGLLGKSRKRVTYNEKQTGCPVYYLTDMGRERLAESMQDDSYLLSNTKRPYDERLEHWIAISESHIRFNTAIDSQLDPHVTMPTFVAECNLWRPDASSSPELFLHIQFPTGDDDRKMSCSPDAACIVGANGKHVALYIEACLGTSSVGQVVARKHQGYEYLANTGLFQTRHFPNYDIQDFRVLVITTNRWRRNQMSRLMKDHNGSQRWRFATWDDFLPEHILHEKFMIDCERKPSYLVKPPMSYVPIGVELGLPSLFAEDHALTNGQAV